MDEGYGDNMEAARTRQQAGAGPSRNQSVRRRRAAGMRYRQTGQRDVIDLTDERPDDDDVQITQVKIVKRPRLRSPAGAAAAVPAPALAAPAAMALVPLPTVPAAAAAAPGPPPAPPSPKGFKCVICLERMEGDLATTTCGHMFCYKCISAWVQKSGNCPQCRTKLSKGKIIRIYPPS